MQLSTTTHAPPLQQREGWLALRIPPVHKECTGEHADLGGRAGLGGKEGCGEARMCACARTHARTLFGGVCSRGGSHDAAGHGQSAQPGQRGNSAVGVVLQGLRAGGGGGSPELRVAGDVHKDGWLVGAQGLHDAAARLRAVRARWGRGDGGAARVGCVGGPRGARPSRQPKRQPARERHYGHYHLVNEGVSTIVSPMKW